MKRQPQDGTPKRPLDVRLDRLHAEALLRLQRHNTHRYPIDTARELIRAAAQEAGVWPTPEEIEASAFFEKASGEAVTP